VNKKPTRAAKNLTRLVVFKIDCQAQAEPISRPNKKLDDRFFGDYQALNLNKMEFDLRSDLTRV
jgi:hypothetical protein